jgi:curli production assembly/transport component CsgG
VAVYAFRDQTGQYKTSPDSAYSTAVSQGAASMLVIALRESGWFMPVEREGLQNLLTERRIVRAIESPSDKGKPAISLPNLTPASLLVEGAIVAYESNVRTGGKGANYLGIGANTQYRIDQVTLVLRSVDIKTGHVLNSVSSTKTIYSFLFNANIYKFIDFQKLVQSEFGYTTNEPAQMALKEAIELAVIQLTVDGIRDRHLALKRPEDWSSPIIQFYAAADNANFADEAQPTCSKKKKAQWKIGLFSAFILHSIIMNEENDEMLENVRDTWVEFLRRDRLSDGNTSHILMHGVIRGGNITKDRLDKVYRNFKRMMEGHWVAPQYVGTHESDNESDDQ